MFCSSQLQVVNVAAGCKHVGVLALYTYKNEVTVYSLCSFQCHCHGDCYLFVGINAHVNQATLEKYLGAAGMHSFSSNKT